MSLRTRLPSILRRAALLAYRRGTAITLRWVETTGATEDATTGALVGGTATAQSEVVKCPVHFVSAANVSQVRQFAEVEIGDVLLDLPAATEVDTRRALTFLIDGRVFERKTVGSRLARSFDVVVDGHRFFRTVLVRPSQLPA